MIRRRTDAQILTSAGQMDGALTAGLPATLLAALVDARTVWQTTGDLTVENFTVDVTAGLGHPAALGWDGVFVTAARQRARVLSVPVPNVAP